MPPQGTLWQRSVPTPLDPPETPVDPDGTRLDDLPSDEHWTLCDTFRHSGWRSDRLDVATALRGIPVPPSRLRAFCGCGASHWIFRHKTDPERFRVVPDHCHDRFCLPCGLSRQATIRRNLATHLRDGAHRFLTLTIRHTGESLAEMIDHLYDSFRRLRNRRGWKSAVAGGAAFLEVTWSEDTQSWHPHLHAMLEGRYFDLQDIKRLWLGVTGDSHAVHIRIVRDKREVVHYITKYATKPLPSSVIRNAPLLAEAVGALHGRRMVLSFGTWKTWALLDDPSDDSWQFFDHVRDVERKSWDGDSLCENILSMLPTADAQSGEFVVVDDGPAPDD